MNKTTVKNYTPADIDKNSAYTAIWIDQKDFISKPMRHHLHGLSYTATGYGRKIPSAQCIMFNGRLRRVYACCFSNNGTAYITGGGNWGGGHIVIYS